MLRSALLTAVAPAATVALIAAPRPALATSDPCAALGAFEYVDRPAIVGTPGTVGRNSLDFETGYYQNASSVGGTALAAYPLVRLRYGLLKNVELFGDMPNAIAKSGLAGRGIYTSEQAGYGVKITLGSSPRITYAVKGEITPPNPATSIIDAKERYLFGFDSLVRLTPRFRLGGSVDLADGRRYGRAMASDLAVREGLSLGYALSNATSFTTELATESGSRHGHAVAHTLGDVIVRQQLSKRVLFDVELGSSFNTIHGVSKPHYLGSGLALKI